jgi:hypothetical protein
MKKFVFFIFLFSSSLAFAGSADAVLICKSASGRTVFTANLQDLVAFTDAKFSIDGQTLIYSNSAMGHLVFNEKNKVLTLAINDDKIGWLTFYAIPSTFKTLESKRHRAHYKFKAVIQGKDPRKDEWQSKEITLDCELTYSI